MLLRFLLESRGVLLPYIITRMSLQICHFDDIPRLIYFFKHYSQHNHVSHVRYRPDLAEQLKWSPKGIDGTFSIEYDVQRDNMYGDVAINDV